MQIITAIKHMPPWQQRLHERTFGALWAHNGNIKANVARPPEKVAASVAIASGYPRQVALRLMATKFEFQAFVRRMAMLSDIPKADINSMYYCTPPGVVLADDALVTTCKQYTHCPFCRYTLLERQAVKFLPYLDRYKYIAMLKLWTTRTGDIIPSAGSMENLNITLDTIYRSRWNNWPVDVVITVPRLSADSSRWVIVTTILALTNNCSDLWDPKAKIGSSAKWSVFDSDPVTLIDTLTTHVGYQAPMLYESWPADKLADMYQLTSGSVYPVCRCRTHGLTRLNKIASQPIRLLKSRNKEQHDKWDCIDGGHTSPPANLEQQA